MGADLRRSDPATLESGVDDCPEVEMAESAAAPSSAAPPSAAPSAAPAPAAAAVLSRLSSAASGSTAALASFLGVVDVENPPPGEHNRRRKKHKHKKDEGLSDFNKASAELADASAGTEAIQSKLKALENSADANHVNAQLLREQLASAQLEIRALREELDRNKNSGAEDLAREHGKRERERKDLKHDLRRVEAARETAEASLKESRTSAAELQRQLEAAKDESVRTSAHHERTITALREEVAEAAGATAKQRSGNEAVQAELEALQRRLEAQAKEAREAALEQRAALDKARDEAHEHQHAASSLQASSLLALTFH